MIAARNNLAMSSSETRCCCCEASEKCNTTVVGCFFVFFRFLTPLIKILISCTHEAAWDGSKAWVSGLFTTLAKVNFSLSPASALYAQPPACTHIGATLSCSVTRIESKRVSPHFSFCFRSPVDTLSGPTSLRTETFLCEWMRESPQRPTFLRASSRKNADDWYARSRGVNWLL